MEVRPMPNNNDSTTVKKIPAIIYNTIAKTATSATFDVTLNEVKTYLANMATASFGRPIKEDWIKLIVTKNEDSTTYDPRSRRNVEEYKKSWQILLPPSFNLYVNTRKDEMLGRVVGDYDPNIVEFVKKYARLNDKKGKRLSDAIKESTDDRGNTRGYVIQLSWKGVFEEMFDVTNYYYKDAFGTYDRPVKLNLLDVIKDNCYDDERQCFIYGDRNRTWCYGEEFYEFVRVTKSYDNGDIGSTRPITRGKLITIA